MKKWKQAKKYGGPNDFMEPKTKAVPTALQPGEFTFTAGEITGATITVQSLSQGYMAYITEASISIKSPTNFVYIANETEHFPGVVRSNDTEAAWWDE